MDRFTYAFKSASRTILLTLNTLLLAYVLIDAYIDAAFDTVKIIFIVILGLNILAFMMNKPAVPETKTHDNSQTAPETPGSEQDQA
jgi:hypothetical protein